MPRSWYALARLGQGFTAGLAVGILWALWVIRRRSLSPGRTGPSVG